MHSLAVLGGFPSHSLNYGFQSTALLPLVLFMPRYNEWAPRNASSPNTAKKKHLIRITVMRYNAIIIPIGYILHFG
jgi:hypothetical protein